jgi:beta-1,4-N-acetylglucosaminyltransferase
MIQVSTVQPTSLLILSLNKLTHQPQQPKKMTSTKLCFLTVGATASFSALIEAAVSPAFLAALEAQGYTELSVQYGQDGKNLFEKCKAAAQSSSPKVKVTGFDLDKLGLGKHMRRAKGGSSKESVEGVVISHAGKLA